VKIGIVAELLRMRQHFFRFVCGCRGDLLDAENFGKLFLSFFYRFLLQIQHPEAGISGRGECRNASRR
jgi:hypothetical protein